MPKFDVHAIARIAALAAASAAFPLLLSSVASAEPVPEPVPVDPRAECESPNMGGVFVTTPSPDAVARSECQYIVEGHFYYDNYENGVYTGTLVYRDGAKVPTERPPIPDQLTLPTMLGPIPFIEGL